MKIKEKMHNHEDFELNNAYTEDEESSPILQATRLSGTVKN